MISYDRDLGFELLVAYWGLLGLVVRLVARLGPGRCSCIFV